MFLPLVLDQNLSGIAAVAEDLAEHLGKFERLHKGSLRELAMPLKKRIMKGYNFAGESKGGAEKNEQ